MDSRTKFYGPVLAMLSLSAVAFNGFVTPPIESEESTFESEERQEEVQPANQGSEPNTAESPDTASPPEGDTPVDGPPTNSASNESATDPSDPVPLIDLLFIPITDEASQSRAIE